MKKLFNLAAIALASIFAFCLAACNAGSEGNDGSSISVNPKTVSLPGEGSTKSVTVTSSSDWDISFSDTWIEAAKSGNTLTITAGSTAAARSGNVTVSNAEGNTAVVIVNQAAAGSSEPEGIDALVGTWSVTSHYWGIADDLPIEYNSVITKVDDSTIRVSPFLGVDAIREALGFTVSSPSEDWIQINYDNGTLTIPHKTRIDWWNGNSTPHVLGAAKSMTVSQNLNLYLPTYTVEGTGSNLSINFEDPDGVDFSERYGLTGVLGSFTVLETDEAGVYDTWWAVFLGTKFTKISNSTTL